VAAAPVISIQRQGDGRNRILPDAKWRPLEGVRVIDITHVLAGPWLTRVLAEQGADVISIRSPDADFLYPAIFGESYGKKQIFLNLTHRSVSKTTFLLYPAAIGDITAA
jgi:hypothetical protein